MGANTATANIAFPSIGKVIGAQYSESVVSNALRSEMTGGYSKVAKRSSKQIKNHKITYVFSAAEYDTFKYFFHTTAADGTLFFVWTDVASANNDIKDARIVDGTYEAMPVNGAMRHWLVTLNIETYAR